MLFYNLTLHKATGITCAISGNFTGRQIEIAVSRGKILELICSDPFTGKLCVWHRVEIFGRIQSLKRLKLKDFDKECLVVTSDSGKITILAYDAEKNMFIKIGDELLGKNGCHRTVPGQFLALNPKGQALMISALQNESIVYKINHEFSAQPDPILITPIELHNPDTLIYDIVGIDNSSSENPLFACLEKDLQETDKDHTGQKAFLVKQNLSIYEIDFTLKKVLRKYYKSLDINDHGNLLISVPGDIAGANGVIICSENYVTYKNFDDKPDIWCPIPRRKNDLSNSNRGVIFVCYVTCKIETMCFFLVQTEEGDIFKMTLDVDHQGQVLALKLKYFDTISVASSLCFFQHFLFVASDFGNHYLYKFLQFDDADEREFSSIMAYNKKKKFVFIPHELKNLVLVDEMENLSPIIDFQIANLSQEYFSQLYVACGQGPRSTLRVLRHGLEVFEMAVTELPSRATGIWALKRNAYEKYHSLIVISFNNSTTVLGVDDTIEQIQDSGFIENVPTIACAQIGADAILQIYPNGIQHINPDRSLNVLEIEVIEILCAIANQQQLIVALTGGELIYFVVDHDGNLNQPKHHTTMTDEVSCMAITDKLIYEEGPSLLAIGLKNKTIHIISFDNDNGMQPLCIHLLPNIPESLLFTKIGDKHQENIETFGSFYLNIGLRNGNFMRTAVKHTGELFKIFEHNLGTKPVKLYKATLHGNETIITLSNKPWLSYYHHNIYHLTPLLFEELDYTSGFESELSTQSFIAVSNDTLRLLSLTKLGTWGDVFKEITIPLEYTPHKFIIYPESKSIILIERDKNAYTADRKKIRKKEIALAAKIKKKDKIPQSNKGIANALTNENLPEPSCGFKAGLGTSASLIRILDLHDQKTILKIPFEQNEAAMSLSLVTFASEKDDFFLLVGVVKHMMDIYDYRGGLVYTYIVLNQEGKMSLELMHKTPVEDMPLAICPFQGKVLIGVGNNLRIYDYGKNELIKKCELKNLSYQIITIHAKDNIIIVGDIRESFMFILYKALNNELIIIARDMTSRWIISAYQMDISTIVGADKLGNIVILRIPSFIHENIEAGDEEFDINKAMVIANYNIGEIVHSLHKATLIHGGPEAILYATLSGSIGILMPFASKTEYNFFKKLEEFMRVENPPLCGNDHYSFRSYYFPQKNIIDGDLCEQFFSLTQEKKNKLIELLDTSLIEVSNKLESLRIRCAF